MTPRDDRIPTFVPSGADAGGLLQRPPMFVPPRYSSYRRRPAAAASERPRTDRLTVAAGIALLVIMVLHTAVFVGHDWWAAWLAGPFRTEQLPAEAGVMFWALPGGFVVPSALLALGILREGRRGRTVPAVVGIVLGAWAIGCVWIVGPSGFVTLLVPAALLLMARARRRTRRPRIAGARSPRR